MIGMLTEICKVDGSMSDSFMKRVNLKGSKVYFVCEYSDMEVLLEEPEYRNNVKYRVKSFEENV